MQKMIARTVLYLIILLPSEVLAQQRQMVVVNAESKVPIRDVRISADNGLEKRTAWDGLFTVPDTFTRIDLAHPDFEHRYVLKSELNSDTIFLIPNINALREVVIYGERRFDKRMAEMLRPSPEAEKNRLPDFVPAGPDVLALAVWLYDKTIGKKAEARSRRKRALKEVRRKEEELQQRWDSIFTSPCR